MQDNIIVKPSVEKQFDRFLRQGRVLFFSAPCGFGKTVLADTLLDGRPVLRLNALEWSGNAKWHKRLMADVRAQAAI